MGGEFADTEVAALTRRQINDAVARMSTDGKSASTIRNMLVPLAAMFRYAIEEDQLPGITTNAAARITVPTEAKKRRRKIVPHARSGMRARPCA